MPRKPRQLVDNGYYHLIARGNNKLYIFKKNEDFEAFKAILSRAKEKYPFKLHHYCLMSNHFHLLIQIERGITLLKIMQWVLFAYARHYKRNDGYVGHLWQGRYKSPRIDSDSYLLECGRYIERNPVRARMVDRPDQYSWSSYHFYAQGMPDGLVDESPYYADLGVNSEIRQKSYQDFIGAENPYADMIDQSLLERHF